MTDNDKIFLGETVVGLFRAIRWLIKTALTIWVAILSVKVARLVDMWPFNQ